MWSSHGSLGPTQATVRCWSLPLKTTESWSRSILISVNSFRTGRPHAGLVSLPDTPAERRIALMSEVLERQRSALEARAVITIRGERVRVSWRSSTGAS